MPRPTPAQFVHGSVTVVLSTLAMLLLSGARSGPGVVVIAVAGLALGVLVATLTMPWAVRGQGEEPGEEGAHRLGHRPSGGRPAPRGRVDPLLGERTLRR